MSDSLNILIQSSDFYSTFAGVTLESLFYNNQDVSEIRVFLISDGIKDDNKKKFSELAAKYNREIIIINGTEIGAMLDSLKVTKLDKGYTTYYKLFVDRFISDSVDRLLYLDSDLIIDGSLRPLIDLEFDENVATMAVEVASETHKANIGASNRYYFNAGVILFDFKKWKDEKWSDKILHHLTTVHGTYPLYDQDILNILLEGRISRLDIKYNLNTDLLRIKKYKYIKKIFDVKEYYSEEEFTEALGSIVIYHCMQYLTVRPWVKGSKCPVTEKWEKYLAQSPWKGFEKIKDTRGFALKCQSVLFDILPKNMFAFINRHITKYLQNKRARINKIRK